MRECPTCRLCFSDQDDFCPGDGSPLNFVFAGNVILEDRYRLEQCIGRGGMGIVYKARHILLKTLHAIKVILPELAGGDPGLVRRFRQEAMVAASIRHQNIVTVTDFGVVGEKMPFIVMDFIKGELLHDVLEREGKLPAAKVLEIISAIAAGVGAAHQQGIVHRDLKPLNVILQDGLPFSDGLKILDFGLAKIKSGDVFGSFVLAQTTGLMGSPYYMAPEQWSEEEPDARADIYSMGIMLYQMLAGQVPFRGPSVPVIMKKHMFDLPPTFASLGADVAPGVDVIVRRCLEKDPANRPATVEELIQDLRHAIGPSETSRSRAQTLTTAPPARRRTRAKEKATQTDPAVRASGSRRARTVKESFDEEVIRKQAEQERLLAEAKARAEEEARMREEHERLLAVERERAEQEARKRAELEHKLNEERSRAEAERLRHEELARRLEAERKRRDSGERFGFPPSTLAKLDETSPPQSLAPQTLPQMSMHPEAFLAASGPSHETEAVPPPAKIIQATHPQIPQAHPPGVQNTVPPKMQDTMAESIPSFPTFPEREAIVTPPRSSRAPIFIGIAAGVIVLLLLGGVIIYLLKPAAKIDATPSVAAPATMAAIAGGKFSIGRDVGAGQYRRVEGPPNEVSVGPILMDKTEVTSAEYADCVKSGDCSRPDKWTNNDPPKGEEKWPVRYVSLADAEAFAAWRSKRDGVQYRLPTEAEWEYAARSGKQDYLYPWGAKWIDRSANIATHSPQAVGSNPQGASAQGVQDLIGNVWEWTSSKASIYAGNPYKLDAGEEGKSVIRGGCYGNDVTGEESVTAASRRWLPASTKNEYIGFRLVRSN